MPICWHCKAESPEAHYERVVLNTMALHAHWDGWRMAGRFLIAPGPAGRITPERLLGMLWEEQARVTKRRSPEKNGTMTPAVGVIVPFLKFSPIGDGDAA